MSQSENFTFTKRPSFQFYPNDWLTDTALNQCTIEAQGLWMRLICQMHNSEEYGNLIVAGQILDEKRIRNGINMTPKKFKKAFQELVNFKVIKQDGRGAFYSKRLIEDEKLRQVRAASGKLGGNPNLVNRKVNSMDNYPVNQILTPSSSPSSSLSMKQESNVIGSSINCFESPGKKDLIQEFERFWELYHTLTQKPKSDKDPAFKKWNKLTQDERRKAVDMIPAYAKTNIPEFLKKARTYLDDRNFNDEMIPFTPKIVLNLETNQRISPVNKQEEEEFINRFTVKS